ncbi:hypothetical protein [Candidatus Ichthyocystis hellenicum]|nr:hypothetical protein [Candidatus Ichthyocystis hellenicum]
MVVSTVRAEAGRPARMRMLLEKREEQMRELEERKEMGVKIGRLRMEH